MFQPVKFYLVLKSNRIADHNEMIVSFFDDAGDQHLLQLRQHNHGQLQQQGEGQGDQWHQHSQG